MQMLTIRDVAERLNMSAQGARNLCRSGELPCIEMGRVWRIEEAAFLAFLERRRADAVARAEARRAEARR